MHGLEHAEDDMRILKEDLKNTIEPPIEVEFDVRPNGPRAIIVLSVPAGSQKPYIFTPTSQIYVRSRADTHVASRQEIIDLVLSSHAPGARIEGRAQKAEVSQTATVQAGEPLSPGQQPPKAVPVPTHGVELPTREQPQQRPDERPSRPQATDGRTARPQSQPQPQQERPRPSWMQNLPPERIKGQVKPMVRPEETPEAEDALAEVEQEAAAQAEEATAQPETAPAKRGRGSRSRKAATDTAVEQQVETAMEATVAAEHETREEIVAEAAEASKEKPKRGRRRKADAELQVEAPTAASAATEAAQEAILVEAEIEPGAQLPAELPDEEEAPPAKKSRSRRKTAAQKAAEAAVEEVETIEAAEVVAPPPTKRGRGKTGVETRPEAVSTAEKAPTKSKGRGRKKEASSAEPPDPPNTGVEIVEVEERGGKQYHTMRDLRNGQTVHNVTRQSARRLWLYAVQQTMRGAPEISEIFWHPDAPIGVWRRGNRAGAFRYDLVARYPDGSIRIFYGVTPEGLRGPWEEVARMAEEAGYEGPEPTE
jgi:hypothetical protein